MDAASIILGFTGYIGSGCTFIANQLRHYSTGGLTYNYYKLSDIIRENIKEGEEKVETLQNKGNELRKINENGGILVDLLLDKIDQEITSVENVVVIDGIKNTGEVATLRGFPNFYLFSVQSSTDVRRARCLKDGRFKDNDEFDEADKRDILEDNIYGQQVKKCNYLSDIIILNENNFADANEKSKTEFIRKIYDDYVKFIEDSFYGKQDFQRFPSIDETSMTIAYACSKGSSCIKRKVGAVIVDTIKSSNDGGYQAEEARQKVVSYPLIVSSGFNEVPLGSYHCIQHPKYQMCYRDYLQESHAEKIQCCPQCGKPIALKIECPKCKKPYDKFKKVCDVCKVEIDFHLICENCGSDIYQEFLPGEKKTPGKLLDMCRALHAEENALLNLVRSGTPSNQNLTMYVTTQPCNLCANKIVSAGIKKVVYDEPYPMEEANDILKNGGVEIKRFQGVKSSAFFKFYR